MGYHPVFGGVILGYRPHFDVIAPSQGDIKIRSKLSPSEIKNRPKIGIFLDFFNKNFINKKDEFFIYCSCILFFYFYRL